VDDRDGATVETGGHLNCILPVAAAPTCFTLRAAGTAHLDTGKNLNIRRSLVLLEVNAWSWNNGRLVVPFIWILTRDTLGCSLQSMDTKISPELWRYEARAHHSLSETIGPGKKIRQVSRWFLTGTSGRRQLSTVPHLPTIGRETDKPKKRGKQSSGTRLPKRQPAAAATHLAV